MTTTITFEKAMKRDPFEFEVHFTNGNVMRYLGLRWEYECYIVPKIKAGDVKEVYAVYYNGRYSPNTKMKIDIGG